MLKYDYAKAKQTLRRLPHGAELLIRLSLRQQDFMPLLKWYADTPQEMQEVAAAGVAYKLKEELGGDIAFWRDALDDISSEDYLLLDKEMSEEMQLAVAATDMERFRAFQTALREALPDAPLSEISRHLAERGIDIAPTQISRLRNVTAYTVLKVSVSQKKLISLTEALIAIRDSAQASAQAAPQPVSEQSAPQDTAPVQPVDTQPLISELPLQRMTIREMFEKSPTGKITAMDVVRRLGLPNIAAAKSVLAEVRGARHLGNQQYELSL